MMFWTDILRRSGGFGGLCWLGGPLQTLSSELTDELGVNGIVT
jgi:hypothetical protein